MVHTSTTAGSSPSSPPVPALVLIGVTGDLGRSALIPAIAELVADDALHVPVVGIGRTELRDGEFEQRISAAMPDDANGHAARTRLHELPVSYLVGDATERDTFDRLAEHIDALPRDDDTDTGHDADSPTTRGDSDSSAAPVPVVYAAMPPALLGDLAHALGQSALGRRTRLVVEKPLGHDEGSAREIHRLLESVALAGNVLVVDHFLAKAAVENLTVVRASNPILDHLLRADHVTSIEVRMCETDTLDDRGSFYESVGVVGDVLQNHVLQMLALATMVPAASGSADAAHRVQLLRSVEPLQPDRCTLGQFAGYRRLDGVDPGSDVPTYIHARTSIDHWRWRGVPVDIVAGKALAHEDTSVTFVMGSAGTTGRSIDNRVRFAVSPTPRIELDIGVIGDRDGDLALARLSTDEPDDSASAYAAVLAAGLAGDSGHFATLEGVIEGWRIVAPICDVGLPVEPYGVGTDGPRRQDPIRR